MKLIASILCLFFLTGCEAKNDDYYWRHYAALKSSLNACPDKIPAGITCDRLKHIGEEYSKIAADLQRNPQLFGQKILALQQNIAKQKAVLATESNESIKASVKQKERQLFQYMAVVSRFESPEGFKDENTSQ